MKVSGLEGAALDRLVAKIEGVPVKQFGSMLTCCDGDEAWAPSRDWKDGGPIIERERIGVAYASLSGIWVAMPYVESVLERRFLGEGKTPLIAAMRAYVASKYGDEVTE